MKKLRFMGTINEVTLWDADLPKPIARAYVCASCGEEEIEREFESLAEAYAWCESLGSMYVRQIFA